LGILHNFSSAGQSESQPREGVTEGPDGALYGVVSTGGTNLLSGAVFRLEKDGSGYLVLRLFGSDMDGQCPLAGLIKGRRLGPGSRKSLGSCNPSPQY